MEQVIEARLSAAIARYADSLAEKKTFVPAELVAALEPVLQSLGLRQRMRPAAASPARILIVRDDAAGDFVLFSPVLREIRRLYPAAHITLVVSPRNEGLAVHCPYVDEIYVEREAYPADDAVAAFPAVMALAAKLRALSDRPFDLAFTPRIGILSPSLLVAYLTGARERVGWSQDRLDSNQRLCRMGWDALLTVAVPFEQVPLHDVDRNLFLLEHLVRLPIADRRIEIWTTKEERREARRLLSPIAAAHGRKYYAVACGASLPMKMWPPEYYGWLLAQIATQEKDACFVLLGGPGDCKAAAICQRTFGQQLASPSKHGTRIVNLTGKVPFAESAALVQACQTYIGNDTGLMHVAAAAGLPVLSVNCFPASLQPEVLSIPVRFTPYHVPSVTVVPREARDGCADRWRHGCSHQNEAHCILGVRPEAALAAWGMLQDRTRAGNILPMMLRS